MDSDTYKQLYEFEEKQRTHLAATINVPILACTIVGGGLATAILQYPYCRNLLSNLFAGFCGASALSLLAAVAFIFLALLGYEYQKLASPIVLREHYKSLVAWYLRHDKTETEAKAKFDDGFLLHLATATDANGKNNRNRGNYIYRANLSVSVAVLFLALAGALYVYAALHLEDKTYNVRIVQ